MTLYDVYHLPQRGNMLGRREKLMHDLVGVCMMDAEMEEHVLRLAEDWQDYERTVREIRQLPGIVRDALGIIWAGGGWGDVAALLGRLAADEWEVFVRSWVLYRCGSWLVDGAATPPEPALEDDYNSL